MILEDNSAEVKVSIFGGTEDGKFAISEDASRHIMNVLSRLYSNPELSVVREYVTNARDSHILAGKMDTPIEVRLPTLISPMLEVQDFGVGMTYGEVITRYTMYGYSSKSTSNDFTGQLGFGCKSAFSVSRQFSVRTVKDGKGHVFSMYKDDNNSASVSCLDSFETEEENNTLVTIPMNPFKDNSLPISLLKFMDFPIKVDGHLEEAPTPTNILELGSGRKVLFFLKKQTPILDTGLNLRMGGVVYPVDLTKLPKELSLSGYGIAVLVDCNIGDFNFTPNREELQYDYKTTTFLDNLGKDIMSCVSGIFSDAQRYADEEATCLLDVIKYLEGTVFPTEISYLCRYHINYKGAEYSVFGSNKVNAIAAVRTNNGQFRFKKSVIDMFLNKNILLKNERLIMTTYNRTLTENMREFARLHIEPTHSEYLFLGPFEGLTLEETYGNYFKEYIPFKAAKGRKNVLAIKPEHKFYTFSGYSLAHNLKIASLVEIEDVLKHQKVIIIPVPTTVRSVRIPNESSQTLKAAQNEANRHKVPIYLVKVNTTTTVDDFIKVLESNGVKALLIREWINEIVLDFISVHGEKISDYLFFKENYVLRKTLYQISHYAKDKRKEIPNSLLSTLIECLTSIECLEVPYPDNELLRLGVVKDSRAKEAQKKLEEQFPMMKYISYTVIQEHGADDILEYVKETKV